jgi:hypothetical protein
VKVGVKVGVGGWHARGNASYAGTASLAFARRAAAANKTAKSALAIAAILLAASCSGKTTQGEGSNNPGGGQGGTRTSGGASGSSGALGTSDASGASDASGSFGSSGTAGAAGSSGAGGSNGASGSAGQAGSMGDGYCLPGSSSGLDACRLPETWQVVVDVFSGRPNPTFTLTEAEVVQAKDRMSHAQATAPAGASGIRPSILGYRGMIISDSLEVYKGRILCTGPEARVTLDDLCGLEQYLLSVGAASNEIPPEAMQFIREAVP